MLHVHFERVHELELDTPSLSITTKALTTVVAARRGGPVDVTPTVLEVQQLVVP